MRDAHQNNLWAIFNLFALIISGISVSWWFLYYTDAFPVIGGLLGLGGLFTWIAFISNILTDQRKEELQLLFDRMVLQQRVLSIFLLICLLGWWLGFAARRTTLLVDSLEAASGHVLEVREYHEGSPLSPEPVQSLKLSPRGTAKVLLKTPWFGEKEYFIKVSGFPGLKISVSAYQREPLFVPKMLVQRPVVLIRPAARDAGLVKTGFQLEIYIDDVKGKDPDFGIDDYGGQAVWFGADRDVDVPENLLADWRYEFKGARMNEDGVNRWLPPESCGPVDDLSEVSATITALLKTKRDEDEGRQGGEIRYVGEITIEQLSKTHNFPKEIILHEKK